MRDRPDRETQRVTTGKRRSWVGPRRLLLPGLILCAAVGLIALLAFGASGHGQSSSIDAEVASGHFPLLPDASMRLPELGSSSRFDFRQLRGKVVVLNVFASWCTGCRDEAPLMAQEQQVLATHDATIVGVTYEDSAASTASFDHRFDVRYPVLRDPDGSFVRALGDFYVPETFIINRRGDIQALNRYQVTGYWLRSHVADVLRDK